MVVLDGKKISDKIFIMIISNRKEFVDHFDFSINKIQKKILFQKNF
jgi:hypothetical protein